MNGLQSFRFELADRNIELKGWIQPIESSIINEVPHKFQVLLDGDKEAFTVECTAKGWKSEDLVVQQSIVDAVGNHLLLHYG